MRILTENGENENVLSMSLWGAVRSEEHTSELQSRLHLVCRLLLEKKNSLRNLPCECYPSAISPPLLIATTIPARRPLLPTVAARDRPGPSRWCMLLPPLRVIRLSD